MKSQDSVNQSLSLQMMAGNIEPLHGEDPSLPDQVVNASHGQVIEGSYKMCIAADGTVSSVTPVVGIDGADQSVIDALKGWRFPRMPVAVCKMQTLRFEIP